MEDSRRGGLQYRNCRFKGSAKGGNYVGFINTLNGRTLQLNEASLVRYVSVLFHSHKIKLS